jgi:hypothetical protein
MSWRTSLLGAVAGLTFIVAALQGNGPMTARDWALVVAGALLAGLGAVARDAASPPALPPSRVPTLPPAPPSEPPPPVST